MLNRPFVAIDIGSSAIKVVELGGAKQKNLRALGLEVLPAGAVVDGMIQNQDAVEGVLRELLKKLKIGTRGRRAALALNGSSVLIKKVQVQVKDNELAEQVYYEAEQHFQADMAEIYFDYTELPPAAGETGGQPVLLVGAKREMVEQYIALVRSVGMRTGIVECGVFSAANMFEYNYGVVEGLTAVVNIGASITQVGLVANGDYVYTRDIAIGGEEYSRRIMEVLAVDRDNAETLKVAVSQGDGSVPHELHKVLGELNEQLVAEIQVTIDYFFQSGEGAAKGGGLTSLFLTGGGSRILGLDAALAAALQIPVQIINPFQRVEVNPKKFQMDYILMQGHLYGVAVGLGLRASGDHA
jgi:type IV pilus assembly protein PilM